MSDATDKAPKYTFEIASHFQPSPELAAQLKAGQDLMQSHVDDVLRTFNAAVDRAALLLMETGAVGAVGWPDGGNAKVVLEVDGVPAATVTGEYVRDDGRYLFNVSTIWHAPYQHLAESATASP